MRLDQCFQLRPRHHRRHLGQKHVALRSLLLSCKVQRRKAQLRIHPVPSESRAQCAMLHTVVQRFPNPNPCGRNENEGADCRVPAFPHLEHACSRGGVCLCLQCRGRRYRNVLAARGRLAAARTALQGGKACDADGGEPGQAFSHRRRSLQAVPRVQLQHRQKLRRAQSCWYRNARRKLSVHFARSHRALSARRLLWRQPNWRESGWDGRQSRRTDPGHSDCAQRAFHPHRQHLSFCIRASSWHRPGVPVRVRPKERAALHLTPNGHFLYAAERTSSTLAAFRVDAASGKLTYVGSTPTEKQPRGFNIDPSGRFVVVSGELSDTISSYAIDAATGSLTPIGRYPTGKGANWVEIVAFD